ncbi:MAG: T9SS type A sorting domain-containing protein [Candidatus Latescibacteria bacterium]|nr:T9SS type A sorting domain-containing protein [Candidatus Latescibacterota bacterium]
MDSTGWLLLTVDQKGRVYYSTGELRVIHDSEIEKFPNAKYFLEIGSYICGVYYYGKIYPYDRLGFIGGVIDDDGDLWLISKTLPENVEILKFDRGYFTEISIQETIVLDSSPLSFSLSSHPNPFNPSTTISFTLAEPGRARLTVYDVTGRKVAGLVDGVISAGRHEAIFDGSGLSSGVYISRLVTKNLTTTCKILLMK